jgi:hypothetical protein
MARRCQGGTWTYLTTLEPGAAYLWLETNSIPTVLRVGGQQEELLSFCCSRRLRVPATRYNNQLFLELANQADRLSSLEIASPRCLLGTCEPGAALYQAACWSAPPSVGGWRPFTADDVLHARLRRAVLFYPVAAVDAALVRHPALPGLLFLPGLSRPDLAAVLAEIGDPRWFVDPLRPERTNLLSAFFGLWPSQLPPPAPYEERSRFLRSTWCSIPPCRRHFPWRTAFTKGGGQRGIVAAGKRVLEFIRQTWLDALCPFQRLFDPEKFFSDDLEEADRFRAFAAKLV